MLLPTNSEMMAPRSTFQEIMATHLLSDWSWYPWRHGTHEDIDINPTESPNVNHGVEIFSKSYTYPSFQGRNNMEIREKIVKAHGQNCPDLIMLSSLTILRTRSPVFFWCGHNIDFSGYSGYSLFSLGISTSQNPARAQCTSSLSNSLAEIARCLVANMAV